MKNKRVKIPMAAVIEIKKLQWQIGEIMRDNEALESEVKFLKSELNRYVQPN